MNNNFADFESALDDVAYQCMDPRLVFYDQR